MEYDKLKEKVKKMGLRVTKDIKGKRVKLTKKELESKLKKNKNGNGDCWKGSWSAKYLELHLRRWLDHWMQMMQTFLPCLVID